MPRRIRLRELKQQAQATMDLAQQTLANARATLNIADRAILQLLDNAMAALVVGVEAIEEVLDGVEIEVSIGGKVLPVKLRIKPREEVEDGTS